MPWFNATSVSVTNGATVVSVNAGDDISLAQAAGGLIIGTQPAVEIKRTFLDGSNNKKIELLKPWPYGSQTNQPAVAFPTDGDLAAATSVLKQLIDGFTLATQADAEGGAEATRPMTALRVKQAMDKLLGTASKLTATTAFNDSTPGRALRVGDFGVGGSGIFIADANAITVSGIYSTAASWVGSVHSGVDGANQGYIQHYDWGGGYALQRFTDVNGQFHSRERRKNAGVWDPIWQVVYSSANAVGPIAFSGGANTGAIIERGGNANGEYVKFADGTMICTFARGAPLSVNPYGAISGLYAGSFSWTFPVAFVGGFIICAGAGVDQAAVGWVSATAGSVGAASVTYLTPTANISQMNVTVTAIGRWR